MLEQAAITCPLTSLAKSPHIVRPIEIKIDQKFFPNTNKIINANKTVGKDQNKLIKKEMRWSKTPPKYPDNAPSKVPIKTDKKTEAKLIKSVNLSPIIILL